MTKTKINTDRDLDNFYDYITVMLDVYHNDYAVAPLALTDEIIDLLDTNSLNALAHVLTAYQVVG